jgi:hypothetical protein
MNLPILLAAVGRFWSCEMSRIRTIKPEFWTSSQVAECSPTARLLFVGMWTFADDGGNQRADLKRLKMEVFPGDAFDNDQMLILVSELLSQELIVEYEADGVVFWHITGFCSHQKIDKPSYKFPEYSESGRRPFDEYSENGRRPFDDSSPPEGSLMESKGMESKGMESKGMENKPPKSPKGDRRKSYSPNFERFWQHFPATHKTRKADAWKEWQNAVKDSQRHNDLSPPMSVDAFEEMLISTAIEYKNSAVGQTDYVLGPVKFIRGRCWEDDRKAWAAKVSNGQPGGALAELKRQAEADQA